MHRTRSGPGIGLLLIGAAGITSGQPAATGGAESAAGAATAEARTDADADTDTDAGRRADGGAEDSDRRRIGPPLDSCFNSVGMIDISVLDDQHLYVRTRGSNYYLITTDRCDNLERSFLHRTAYLVPHGRTVCRDDGSHVLYDDAGRQSICPIRMIERVDDRAQARDLAAGRRSLEGLEELPVE